MFAAELAAGVSRTRTVLARLARMLNKPLPMPALVLFRHGDTVTLGVIKRRLNQRDAVRDVLEQVTLIKDIRFARPHRAHVEILFDLSLHALYARYQPTSFVKLHEAWHRTLDIQALNRRFFIEIRNWFYWARLHARFPAGATKDEGRDSEALIRLLTRLIFCWFLNEKGLIPDKLFSERVVSTLLRDWPAASASDTQDRYYKAILQNLFFATLNMPVAERKFRTPHTFQGRNQHYGDQRYFRWCPSVYVMSIIERGEPVLDGFQGIQKRCWHPKAQQLRCSPDVIRHPHRHGRRDGPPLTGRSVASGRFRGGPFLTQAEVGQAAMVVSQRQPPLLFHPRQFLGKRSRLAGQPPMVLAPGQVIPLHQARVDRRAGGGCG